jgi:Tfp pilus assembly protein PilV
MAHRSPFLDNTRGITIFEALIVLLILVLVAMSTVFIAYRIDQRSQQNHHNVEQTQNLLKSSQ